MISTCQQTTAVYLTSRNKVAAMMIRAMISGWFTGMSFRDSATRLECGGSPRGSGDRAGDRLRTATGPQGGQDRGVVPVAEGCQGRGEPGLPGRVGLHVDAVDSPAARFRHRRI